MLLIVFAVLFAACLGSWGLGAPAWLVFATAFAAWVTFTVVAYPKIRTYKLAMGLDERLAAAEMSGLRWVSLRLAGLKVLLLGFLTSMVPFLGSAAEWIGNQKLDFFFDPTNPMGQQKVMFVIGAVAFTLPFLSSWLHLGAIKDAAQAEPRSPAPQPKD